MFTIRRASLLVVAVVALSAAVLCGFATMNRGWSDEEKEILRSLALGSLPPLSPDPSNRHADDPRAARLGHALFFDASLSSNGRVACATCHLPEAEFQDGIPLARGVGETTRRTMPIAGTAYSAWMFWDGRADSQWSQALGPLESAVEHGGDRTQYVHQVVRGYRSEYEAIFGELPDLSGVPAHAGPVPDSAPAAAWRGMSPEQREAVTRVFVNMGKAIAAYERTIGFGESRFDRYVKAVLSARPFDEGSALARDEVAGLRLFIGKANCINCHNGPLLTDDHFHNTGVPAGGDHLPVDSGRAVGVRQAIASEFSCTSRHSDAGPDDCEELRFAVADGEELARAYKTPSLRNVAQRAPYMHAGQIATLDDAVAHYDRAPVAPAGHSELVPLKLTDRERRQLVAFLRTLSGPLAAPAGFLAPPDRRH